MKVSTTLRAAALFAAVIALPLTVAGCKKNLPQNSTLSPVTTLPQDSITYGMATQPDHLDPFLALSADSRVVLFNLFEGLFKPTPEGEMVPAVAQDYTLSADSRVYTITLRDKVVFHNGGLVTPEDVVYSLQRAVEAKTLAGIESVRATGPGTVEIRLTNPDNEYYYNLTTAIVPKDYTEQNSHPIGTGPFKFVSFTPQQEIVFVKHDAYWNPALPKTTSFTFKIKTDFTSIALDINARTLDAGILDALSALQVNKNDYDLIYDNRNATQTLVLNNKVPPLDNPKVRQAISYAIDIDQIVHLVHFDHAERAASPVIPGLVKSYAKDLEDIYTRDLARAKALLAEAGQGPFSLTITAPSNYEPHVQAAQVIVNQLAEIGIKATVQLVDWATWLSDVYNGRKYEATVIAVDGPTLSPRSYLSRYVSTAGDNFVNYSNPEYDALYARALATQNPDERTALYKDLQRILSRDAASVYMCDIVAPKAFRKGITGYTRYPLYVLDASTLSAR